MHVLNKYFDKIYCISLIDTPYRRLEAQKEFDNIGLEVEFFDAVEYKFGHLISKSLMKTHSCIFNGNNGEFGCFISHYTILKKALYYNYERILVLEDDICFAKNFNNIIQYYINNIPHDWEIIKFYCVNYSNSNNIKNINEYWEIYENGWSTLCYGINKTGIKKILNIFDKSPCVADYPLHTFYFAKIYTTNIPLCIPNIKCKSTIQTNDMELNENIYLKQINMADYVKDDL